MQAPSPTLPTVLNEHQVHLFAFYLHNSIRQGMRHQQELYGEAYRFNLDERLSAYAFASELIQTGCSVVITVSKQSYRLWVRLRSDEYPHWEAMNKVAAIEPIPCSC